MNWDTTQSVNMVDWDTKDPTIVHYRYPYWGGGLEAHPPIPFLTRDCYWCRSADPSAGHPTDHSDKSLLREPGSRGDFVMYGRLTGKPVLANTGAKRFYGGKFGARVWGGYPRRWVPNSDIWPNHQLGDYLEWRCTNCPPRHFTQQQYNHFAS